MALEEAGVPARSLYQSLAYNDYVPEYRAKLDLLKPIDRLQSVSNEFNVNESALDSMLNSIDSKAVDNEDKIKHINYYKSKLDEINNLEDPYEQLRQTKRLGKDFASKLQDSNTPLGKIVVNKQRLDAGLKQIKEHEDKGDPYHVFNLYHDQKTINPDGTLNDHLPQIEKIYDGDNADPKIRESIFNDMKPDARDYNMINDPNLTGIQRQAKIKELTAAKVDNYIKNYGIDAYKASPAYKQEGRILLSQGYSPAQAEQVLKHRLTATGHERLFKEFGLDYSNDPALKYKMEEAQIPNMINTTDTNKINTETPDLLPEISFDEKGQPIDPTKPNLLDSKFTAVSPEGSVHDKEAYRKALDNWTRGKDKDKLKNDINTIASKLGFDNNLSTKAKYDLIKKHDAINKERILTAFKPDVSVQDNLTKSTFRNGAFSTSEFKLGNQTFKGVDEFANYLIENKDKYLPNLKNINLGSVKEYIKDNATVDGVLPGMGRYNSKHQAGLTASLNGEQFIVSADNETGEALRPVNDIQKQILNPRDAGKAVPFIGTDGHTDYFKVVFNKGDYKIALTDKDGKTTIYPQRPIDISDLGKTSLNNYQKSGYLSGKFTGQTKNETEQSE
jgi:hypothetical protein